ncbi:hypothetical protein TNCV_290141 [Trichonephila clavipes]|nr:hypothetical protein TNCV_290141 [Trichonephila clavipes]
MISIPLTEVEKLICSTMSLSKTVLFFRKTIVGMQVYHQFCHIFNRNDGRSPPAPKKLPLVPGTIDDFQKSLPSAQAKMVNNLTVNTIGTRIFISTRITDRSLEFIHSETPTENGGSSMGIAVAVMDNTTSPSFNVSVCD